MFGDVLGCSEMFGDVLGSLKGCLEYGPLRLGSLRGCSEASSGKFCKFLGDGCTRCARFSSSRGARVLEAVASRKAGRMICDSVFGVVAGPYPSNRMMPL
jgi:hypothetical protein